MEAVVDFTCNLVIVVSLVYFGVGLVLELIERWKQIDPTIRRSKVALPPMPLALPESTAVAVEAKQPELETLESIAFD